MSTVFVSSINKVGNTEPRFVNFVHKPALTVGKEVTISDNKSGTYTGVVTKADWMGNHILDTKPRHTGPIRTFAQLRASGKG
jgi:hypothetical protein